MSPKNFGRANIHQCPCDANILLYFDVGIKSVILHCNDRFNAIRKTTPPYVAGVELVLRSDRLMWSRTLDLEDNFRPGRLKKIEFSCPNLITKTTTFNWQTKRWWRATYIGTPAKWRKSQITVLTQASELQRKRNPTKWATIQKVDILLLEIRLIAGVIAKITYRTSYWLSYSKSRFADVWREFLQKPSLQCETRTLVVSARMSWKPCDAVLAASSCLQWLEFILCALQDVGLAPLPMPV